MGRRNSIKKAVRRSAKCVREGYVDPDATLDDLREAVTTLEDAERIARRVFGGAHPLTEQLQVDLRAARAARAARETPSPSA